MKVPLRIILVFVILIFKTQNIFAGPPFGTDDPETVRFRHWEYYISTLNNKQAKMWSGTSPHFEINYGLIENVQVHLLLPVNYSYINGTGAKFGYADTEFGIKFRFIQETDNSPQVGIFPIVEIPTIKNSEFSDGKAKIYLPVWLQKSWGDLTTYGGAGYWINPGAGNKNWVFAGWEVQYNISSLITFGGELFYHTATTKEDKPSTGFNLGGSLNLSEKTHIIFSAGNTFSKENSFTSYLGVLWTI